MVSPRPHADCESCFIYFDTQIIIFKRTPKQTKRPCCPKEDFYDKNKTELEEEEEEEEEEDWQTL